MIIFTHIAKCAGSSIKYGIRDNFEEAYFGGDIAKRIRNPSIYEHITQEIPITQHPDIISNHFPYGIHKLFGLEFSYFTFLRHPIPRAISCFYHNHQRHNPVVNKQKKGQSILRILNWCLQENVNCNVATRQLSGIDDLKKLKLSDVVKKAGGFYHVGTKSSGYKDQEMQLMLEHAKYNLKHHYDFVGFQENSFTDMERLCGYYGWKFVRPHRFLKRKTKSHPDWEKKAVLAVLEKMNEYDLQLYDYARGLRE